MARSDFSQSSLGRAMEDTKESVIGNRFKTWLVCAIILAVVSPMLTALLTPLETTRLWNGVWGFLGAVLGLLFLVLVSYVFHLLAAPYRQRDEARAEIRRLATLRPSDERTLVAHRLKQAMVSLGHTEIDACTVLNLVRGKLAVGMKSADIVAFMIAKFDEAPNADQVWKATNSLLETWSLLQIVREETRRVANVRTSWDEGYWKLTDFGKQVVLFLQEDNDAKT